MQGGDVAPLIAMLTAFVSLVLILRGPVGRALARRIEGRTGEPGELTARVNELEQRLADLDHDRARMAELEERLDFAERLLSQGSREPERLPRGQP